MTNLKINYEREVEAIAIAKAAAGPWRPHSDTIPFRKHVPSPKPTRPAPQPQTLRPAATAGELFLAAVNLQPVSKLDLTDPRYKQASIRNARRS
jgi:hypothetical protein